MTSSTTIDASPSQAMAEDGQVFLHMHQLSRVPLVHLISGMDEDNPVLAGAGALASAVTGYTEWITAGTPAITIGWDWQMLANARQITLLRLGEPRSNLMLQDNTGQGVSQLDADRILTAWIESIQWQAETLAYITRRYA